MTGISIVICTFNGQERLNETLNHILKIKFKGEWELLIIDNASNDKTGIIIQDFFISNPQIQGKGLFEEKPGLSKARRKGWRNAKYDIVLFCDDDNWLNPDYLEIGLNIFKLNLNVGVLGGCGEAVSNIPFPNWFSEFSHSYAVGSNGKSSGRLERGAAHYGAGCFFLKDALNQIDNLEFDIVLSDRKGKELESGGDVELCFLVQLLGYEIWFEENLRFKHFIPSNRLEWAYYLKLKKGISTSFPLLFSYKAIFNKKSKSQLRELLLRSLWYSLKGFILCQFLKLLSPSKRNEVQLVVNAQKLSSFFRNYSRTISHFEFLCNKF
ncbi:glycosyltransferase [Algoriphagus mannitolivorans]|uniref:glycosyltransferase n=1 Tax=Algoriphagus mannitolivorans TaxID=226504 RepID=UPI0003F840BB|nr:glycosyltransferase [Algoriphagus mannitolivorans]